MKKLAMISISLAALVAVAHAGDSKTAAPAAPAKDAKAAPPAKDAKDAKAAPPAEMPKPSAELQDMGKKMAGTWKCTGQAFMDMKDPTKAMDVKGAITNKMDLDNWWIQSSLATTGKMPFKFTSYTGYDAASKKWNRYGVDNMGGAREQSSMGMKDGKILWEGQSNSPMGPMKLRDTEEMNKDGSFHTLGEMSMDGGKTWVKEHDVTCKK
jgi:hypothetical protein